MPVLRLQLPAWWGSSLSSRQRRKRIEIFVRSLRKKIRLASNSLSPVAFVRLASVADEADLKDHRSASSEEAKMYRGHTRALQPEGDELSLVAGFGSTVMGSISASFTSTHAVIQHVYVMQESREVGLGDALLQQLLATLRARGVSFIEAQALPGDRAMKNLFERHGLVAQTIIVGKSL